MSKLGKKRDYVEMRKYRTLHTMTDPLISSGASPSHDPVTLAADADAILGISGQELNLDTQTANTVFAGPTTGGAADPDFRNLIYDDLPDIGAAPALTFSTTDSEGVAESFVRTDAHIGLFSTQAVSTIDAGDTGVTGTSGCAARRDHQHEVNSSADGESFVSTLLNSDANGDVRLRRLGLGTVPSYPLHVSATSEQLRLNYDAGGYASFQVADGGTLTLSTTTDNATGNLKLAPVGDVYFDPTGNDILPQTAYDLNIGSIQKKYLTLHCAELWVDMLVAASTLATIGGRILVAPTDVLAASITTGATTITTKYNEMSASDVVYMEDYGKVEFMRISSGPSGGASPYSYTVARDLDGSGANTWYAGDAIVNTGVTDEGFIDIYSVHGVKSGTEYGPTMVGNIRGSSTHNDWAEHWALGNLNGIYGYSSNVYGVALGKYAASNANIMLDSTNGLQIKNYTTVKGLWDTSGNIRVGETGAGKNNVYINAAGELQLRTDTTWKMKLDANGALLIDAHGDMFFSDADGLLLIDFQTVTEDGGTWYVHGTRGEKATLSGAIDQVRGRWQGTRGLVIEEATPNLIENPSIEVDTSLWQALGAGSVISRVTTDSTRGSAALEVSAADVASAGARVHYLTDRVTVTASQDYTFAMDVRVTSAVDWDLQLAVLWYTAGGSPISTSTQNFTAVKNWDRYSLTDTAPGTAATAELRVQRNQSGTHTYLVDAVQFEQKDHATTYCDGDQGVGYTWSGTEHDSSSARAATEVNLDDYSGLIKQNGIQSHRVVIQAPYDYNETWNHATQNYIFDAYDSSSGGRIRLYYNPTDYKIYCLATDGTDTTTMSSDALSFSAGDWLDVIVALDFNASGAGDYYLFVNGAQEVHDTTANVVAPVITQWNLGSAYDGSTAIGDWVFSEYAVLGDLIGANEAAALYQRWRPLVDAGARDKPGIYTLDGLWRMASSLTGDRVDVRPEGIAVYRPDDADSTAEYGFSKILMGRVEDYDSTSASDHILSASGADFGVFGYNASDELEVAMLASGSYAGQIRAAGSIIGLNASGIQVEIGTSYDTNRSYRYTASGSTVQTLAGYYDEGVNNVLWLRAEESGSTESQIIVGAYSASNLNAYVSLWAYNGLSDHTTLLVARDYSASNQYAATNGAFAAACGLTIGSCNLYAEAGVLLGIERSSSPAKPSEGGFKIWMSDGTELGDDGDVIVGVTAGGNSKYTIIHNHSAASIWT